jgi:hypothetical protein
VPPRLFVVACLAALSGCAPAAVEPRGVAWPPEDVAPGDRATYLDGLVASDRSQWANAQAGGVATDFRPDDYHAEVIDKVARLAMLSGDDPHMQRRIDAWLLRSMAYFEDGYVHHGPDVYGLQPLSPWKRAETSFMRWLTWRLPKLDEQQRGHAIKTVFDCDGAPASLACSQRWPGLDVFAMGPLLSADHWVRFVLSDEVLTRRFAEVLGRRDDESLTRAVFDHLMESGSEGFLPLWVALTPYPHLWRAATTEMVEQPSFRWPHGALDTIRALWAANPEMHGSLLYAHAAVTARLSGDEREARAKSLGAPFQASLFEQMLDQSPAAVMATPAVWSSVDPSAPRMKMVIAHLDAFLDTEPPGARPAVESLFALTCEPRDAADRVLLQAYLKGRRAGHPSESAVVVDASAVCGKTLNARP